MNRRLVTAVALLAAGCGKAGSAADATLSAGAATVLDVTHDAFSLPMPILSKEHRVAFFVGNSFFNQNWVMAPASVQTRDGLGPLFNARSCSGCHFKDGRSRPPEAGIPLSTVLLRVSIPGKGPHGEPVPDPVYGDQIQGSAIPGVPREADVVASYELIPGAFADGEAYSLRKPSYRLEHLGFGPPSSDLMTSPRVAPQMVGLGLLEAVPERELALLADPGDADHDGISGRPNSAWDAIHLQRKMGRFGWKAEQPSVRQQAAGAFAGDMGITSSVFPTENHTGSEPPCADQPSGGSPEAGSDVLDAVTLYARTLGVPARRNVDAPAVRRGEKLFGRAGCAGCHVPTLTTSELPDLPELAKQAIHPYTDLLLHDMGEGLSDGRPTFDAEGREWRTPPLWGIGLVAVVNDHTLFLHDGRARGLPEAILWHDGEGARARAAFVAMSRDDRTALVDFVASL